MKRFATWAINVQLVVALLLAFALVGVSLLGLKPFVVMSGSMEPTIHVGSLAYVDTRKAPDQLLAGDVVTFELDRAKTVTHRVVEVDAENRQLTTKGDANPAPDAAAVSFDSVVGKYVFSVPMAGMLLDAFVQNKTAWIVVLLLFNIALLTLPYALGADSGRSR